jgi:microsomal epoxide hydrolase
MLYDKIPNGATLELEKFELKVPQHEVDYFYQSLKVSQLAPKTYESTRTDPNQFGANHDFMFKAKKHWESSYDWQGRHWHNGSTLK